MNYLFKPAVNLMGAVVLAASCLSSGAQAAEFAEIGNRVWNDLNANGTQNGGEPGIDGVVVELLRGHTDNTVIRTKLSNSGGYYRFKYLEPDCYRVRFVLPSGMGFSDKNQGSYQGGDSDVDPTTGISNCITLAAGERIRDIDAGMNDGTIVEPEFSEIGNRVWHDLNGNGKQSGDEPGIDGIVVELLRGNSDDTVIRSKLTNSGGYYRFRELDPDCYRVRFILPNEMKFSDKNVGDNRDIDSDVNSVTGLTDCITLETDDVVRAIDAGMIDAPSNRDGIDEDLAYYIEDNYSHVNSVRVDLKTYPENGLCIIGDYSGCTLNDILNDLNSRDDFKPRMDVSFNNSEYPQSFEGNARLKQRGFSSRHNPQKSFSVKLDSKDVLWRRERRLQLNKHANDISRMRNKLAFDLISQVPHLPSARTQFVNMWMEDGGTVENKGMFTHVEYFGKEYLVNRDWDKDGNLYKAEFFTFSLSDLFLMAVDGDGEPLDDDAFNSRLEIKRGDDHRAIIEMLEELHSGSDFLAVFDEYFDRDNFLAWLSVNILFNHADVGTHNYYLYNPKGSKKFYFLPWDYDSALHPYKSLSNSTDADSLRLHMHWGYGVYNDNVVIHKAIRLPQMHHDTLRLISHLRQSSLNDSRINGLIDTYIPVVRPMISSLPDLPFVPTVRELSGLPNWDNHVEALRQVVANNQTIIENAYLPVSPYVKQPKKRNGQWVLWWTPSEEITGQAINYRVEVSTDSGFNNIVYNTDQISNTLTGNDVIEHTLPEDTLSTGSYYYRVFAYIGDQPDLWQISSNNNHDDSPGARTFLIQ